MKGYPKHVATKQDFDFLLAMPEFRQRALDDLKAIYNEDDDKCAQATELIDEKKPDGGYKTEEIANTMPVYKQKGFASRGDVAKLIKSHGGLL